MWLTFFKKCKPAQNLLFTLFAAFFVRSGWIYLNENMLVGHGQAGWNWSRSSDAYSSATSANAYYLTFNAGTVYPSSGPHARYYGFPVRCLVY